MKILRTTLGLGIGLALASAPAAQVPTRINIEIDFMETASHSHRPSQAALDALVDMFACHGIVLNLLVSTSVPHRNVIQCPDPDNDNFFNCDAGIPSFLGYKSTYSSTSGLPGWHYCLIGHDYDSGDGTGSSGFGEIGGNDFVVTLANTETDYRVAATIAHELGHNLGLEHFSPNSFLAGGPFPVNYASVMSYQYQLNGVASRMECLGLVDQDHRLKDLDYSNGRMPRLIVSRLSERVGVGIHTMDWDCDGVLDTGLVARNLSSAENWCSSTSAFGVLHDYNDWANITEFTFIPAVYLDQRRHETDVCVSIDDLTPADPGPLDLDDPASCFDQGSPTLSTEPCASGAMVWVNSTGTGGFHGGTGDSPFTSLAEAFAFSPTGSVLYLQPGTYRAGGRIILSRRMILAGPGGAVIDP